MSALREAMSHAVLGWVKPELDETLRMVRQEIEAFVETPADTSRMGKEFTLFCLHPLRMLRSTCRTAAASRNFLGTHRYLPKNGRCFVY